MILYGDHFDHKWDMGLVIRLFGRLILQTTVSTSVDGLNDGLANILYLNKSIVLGNPKNEKFTHFGTVKFLVKNRIRYWTINLN